MEGGGRREEGGRDGFGIERRNRGTGEWKVNDQRGLLMKVKHEERE